MMEKLHRDILAELRAKLVADIDVNNIIPQLLREQVLRDEEVLKIIGVTNKEEQAIILLDILPSCAPYAFGAFHRHLRHHYFWLAEDIDTILTRRRIGAVDMEQSNPGSPNLPPQSPMTVTREAKMEQLKVALTKLLPGGYLALHGMKGFGKSCLTANTLKDTSLVENLFTNQVYWIKFGYERSIEDEVLIQLNSLYHQVRNADSLSSTLNSEPLKEHLIHFLKNHFNKREHRNALLILDDVGNKEIIDTFDFHCKTLVITTDIDFLEGKQREIIEMKSGFTQGESLGLFAKSLGTVVDKLPPEARMIHDECNGMPILIAMFAAHFEEFRDEMNDSPDKWKYYLKSLRNKDPSNRLINKFLAKQDVIFDMCIGKLEPEIRSKYEDLVIFSEDVNIMPQTLEILWGLDSSIDPDASHKVADDMVFLCHKSLTAKHWNVHLKSYVYGVHDLLLCHLRRKLTAEKLQQLHRSFVEKYRKYCHGDFSKLPNDNYSYSYIGHHLQQSGLLDEFPKLYLNFDFLQAKIYHTGLSDLLIDLKKYRKLITENTEKGEAKVKDLETFLENQAGVIAEHRRRECLDLVQIGINNSPKGFVYEKSCELATARPTKLYVTHNLLQNNIPTSEEVSTDVRTAYFTDDSEKILIGNYSGEVILWNCKTRSQTVFSGHNKKTAIIKIIVVSEDRFLTLSDDGQVKLFEINEEGDSNGSPRTPTRVRSPREKQPHWSGLFSDAASKDDSNVTFSIPGEKITDIAFNVTDRDQERVAFCTDQGTLQVSSLDGETIYAERMKGCTFGHVVFSYSEKIIILLNTEGLLMYFTEQDDDTYAYYAVYNPNLKSRNVISFQTFPFDKPSLMIVTDINVIHMTWLEGYHDKMPKLVSQVCCFQKREISYIEEPHRTFTCATITHDGNYLVTADNKGSVIVVITSSLGKPIAQYKGRVKSLDSYYLNEECHMICGSEDRVIHRWTLPREELPKSVRRPLFDAVMKPRTETDIVVKELGRKIIVENGNAVRPCSPDDGNIARLSINSKGNQIIYLTDRNFVKMFDCESNTYTQLFPKLEYSPTILAFVTINDSTIVVCEQCANLMIWFNGNVTTIVDTKSVTSIYTFENNNVVTVARSGAVHFWKAETPSDWRIISHIETCSPTEPLSYNSLSPNKKMLSILKGNREMIIFEILKDESIDPGHSDVDILAKFKFDHKPSVCEYSQDNKYLAIGLENGDISIFDIIGCAEVFRLELHCNEIRQLHWAPIWLGGSILMSVNCDELAWWNIAPYLEAKNGKDVRRGRMGISRSIPGIGSSPRSSGRLKTSQSWDLEASGALSREIRKLSMQSSSGDSSAEQESDNPDEETIGNDFASYWKIKTAKHKNRPTLLCLVPLPPSCNSKVCVSDDFHKFLSVDINGSVSNFRLYNDT